MIDDILENIAVATGTYDESTVEVESEVSFTRMTDITVEKVANKDVWAQGDLQYMITVSNNGELSYLAVTVSDVLDPALVALDLNSVYVGGIQRMDYTYNETTGAFSIDIADIQSGGSVIVTFRVTKK